MTTLPKARQARSLAEKMVSLARKQTLAARRQIVSTLRDERQARRLCADIAPQFEGRHGGYTRIVKLGRRMSDSSEMVLLEWVGIKPPERPKKKKKAGEKTESQEKPR